MHVAVGVVFPLISCELNTLPTKHPFRAERSCWCDSSERRGVGCCRGSRPDPTAMSYAASHCSNEEMPAGANARRNYNAEGRRLIESLGLQTGGMYNAMDAVWKDSSTGGKIYVGNETAARGPARTLAEHGITHVVNCTDDMPNFCEAGSSGPAYLRFNVAFWQSAGVMRAEQPSSRQEVLAFLQQLFDFVEGGASSFHDAAGLSLSFHLASLERALRRPCPKPERSGALLTPRVWP